MTSGPCGIPLAGQNKVARLSDRRRPFSCSEARKTTTRTRTARWPLRRIRQHRLAGCRREVAQSSVPGHALLPGHVLCTLGEPHAPFGEQEGCWNGNYSVTVISLELSHRPWMLHRDRAIRLPGPATVIESTARGWVNASPCFASPCALNSKWPT